MEPSSIPETNVDGSMMTGISSRKSGSAGRVITRERRGCLTCRKRKKKCLQESPICSHCSRLNLVCRWEGPRDLNTDAVSPLRTPSTRAHDLVSPSRPHYADPRQLGICHQLNLGLGSQGSEGDDLVGSRRMMLRYYTATLVFMLTNNVQNNCFLSVLLPMAFECPALMYALAASSSAHLALQNDAFRVAALQHSGAAITELKSSIMKGSLTREMRLAVTLVLCSMESISSGTSNWIHHLSGAAACLQEDINPDTSSSTDPKATLSRCYEGRWLLRNFAYHDIIMSVSLDRRPLISGDYWLPEDSHVADPYFGLAAQVVRLIGDISSLNADFVSSLDGRSTDAALALAVLSPAARTIEMQLRDWTCPQYSHDESLVLLAEAYRQAALIHLYRVLRRHVPFHSESLRHKIAQSVTTIVNVSHTMEKGCYAETSMIFPLFFAGGEAETLEQREAIRDGLCSLNQNRKFRNVDACVDVLDELWKRREQSPCGETKKVDWLDVTRDWRWTLALF